MKRADAFELGWKRMVLGRPASGLSEDVSKELAIAYLLHGLSEQIQPPPGAWQELGARIESGEPPAVVSIGRRRPRRPLRVAMAVAAAFALLVAVSLRAGPDSPLYRIRRGSEQFALLLAPHDGALHLRLASARLDDLLFALSKGDFARTPSLADALVAERAAAVSDGADVHLLDARMTSALTPALANAPASVAHTVSDCLDDTVPDDAHDAPGDASNPDAVSDGAGVISGKSAPTSAPSPQPAPSPSYTGSSDEESSSSSAD